MVLAILLGWLPGPGGIPLFLVGLSLLAINHEWAKKRMDSIKNTWQEFVDWCKSKINRKRK
jgi:hypothetical protein